MGGVVLLAGVSESIFDSDVCVDKIATVGGLLNPPSQ